MSIHSYKTGHYFSATTRFMVAFIAFIITFMALLNASLLFLLVFPPFLMATVVALSLQYFIAIDTSRNQYFDGTNVFGIKSGRWTTYSELDLLYIRDKNFSQKINSIGSSTTNHSTRYEGYLTFTEDEKIQLISEDDRDKAIKRMCAIAGDLGLRLYDHDDLVFDGQDIVEQTYPVQ